MQSDTPLTRRHVWRTTAAATAGVAGLQLATAGSAEAAAPRSFDAQVRNAVENGKRTRRSLRELVDSRIAAFEQRLIQRRLPEVVAQDSALRAVLDARYALAGTAGSGGSTGTPVPSGTVVLSQAEFDALAQPDPATLYVVVG